jgi:hypothetical protein
MFGADALRMLRQLNKGAYTNDPADPDYADHWQTTREPDAPILSVYPGTARPQGGFLKPKQMVNVVETASGYYVDTPSVPRVGPVARLAGRGLDKSGLSAPFEIPRDVATVAAPQPNRLVITPPAGPVVTARLDGLVGTPANLSAADQIRNLGRLFKR